VTLPASLLMAKWLSIGIHLESFTLQQAGEVPRRVAQSTQTYSLWIAETEVTLTGPSLPGGSEAETEVRSRGSLCECESWCQNCDSPVKSRSAGYS